MRFLKRILRRKVSAYAQRLVPMGIPIEHETHFRRCLQFVAGNGIEGDVLEFGVSHGGSLLVLDRQARSILQPKSLKYRIFGFDSFQGMPEAQGRDANIHVGNSQALDFSTGAFKQTRENVLARLKAEHADVGNINLVEGFYDQILTPDLRKKLQLKRACFINIDCDFYESAMTALRWCEPLMGPCTIISFDDWFCYEGRPDHGEQYAFSKFLAENPDMTASAFSTYSWNGKAFIVNRNVAVDPVITRTLSPWERIPQTANEG